MRLKRNRLAHLAHGETFPTPAQVKARAAFDTSPVLSEYDQQAADFLARFGIKCRITPAAYKPAAWQEDGKEHGNRYRVTLWRAIKRKSESFTYRAPEMMGFQGEGTFCGHVDHPQRLAFDFWGSINDAKTGAHPSAYDVLACIGRDVHTPGTFAEFGGNADSIKERATWKRCDLFARRLRAFFTAAELDALTEIS